MFGQNSSQPGPLFGQTAAQSGSLFGQTVSQPGSMFGQTASQPGTLFAQTTSQPSPLFGQRVSQPAPLFNQTQISSSGFGSHGSSTTSSFASQSPSFGQSSAFSGSVGGFGQMQAQTTGFGQPASSTGAGPFGQGSTTSRGFGSSSASSSSSSLFGQPSATALGPSASVRPGPFGQSGGIGFGMNSTSSSGGLFGQSAFTAAGGTATTTSSIMFTSAPVFGQTSASSSSTSLFGQLAGGPSAFQSTTSSAAFGQPQASAVSFGTQSLFGQQTSTATTATGFGHGASTTGVFTHSFVKSTSSSAQPSFFGQPSMASGLFTRGTSTAQGFPERTAAFGQQSSTGGTSVTTSPISFAQESGRLGPSSNVRPQTSGLFSTGFGHPSPSGSLSSTGSSNFDLTVGSSSFDLLAARSKSETAGSSVASTNVKGTGLFGKKEQQDLSSQQDQKQGLFGKGLSAPKDSSVTVVTVKQEPASQRTSLFGEPDSSSQHSSSSRTGLFGRGTSRQQAVTATGSEHKPLQPTGREARHVKQEREVKQEPTSGSGLFRKQVSERTTQGLFGRPPKKEETDRDRAEERGFRPRLARVQDEPEEPDRERAEERGFRPRLSRVGDEPGAGTSRSLFGKPVTQSARPARGSDEGNRGRRPSLSRQLSDDNSGKVAIVCRNVPTKYNNHQFLRKHFSRYGYVTKVFPNTSRMQATIHFQTHEQAADAKRRGRLIARGVRPMDIFWSAYTAPISPSPLQRGLDRGQGHEAAARSREDVSGPSRPRTFGRQGDTNINEELESMSGTDDIKYDRRKSPSPKPEEMGSRGSRSPEKRVRSASPGPSTSADKVVGLSSFQGVLTRTTTDRVQLLDQRDKFIRLNRKKKQTDLKRGAFVGTCPDMCPEKERYDREDKRRLSYFEMVPGTESIPGRNPSVDHSRAVKEYIRSSPDQDEPLPHELRPMPVLQMTMTYLLCEVADQGQDGYWGDWFDFLWNRTRGIRKDITQQQLNDRQAVELIEKCARFHIFCSERLCEEDMHSFDAKINNENLTKCLQTLREFYHDLEKKQNVFCQNEAEFRAYTVLMNLNEGDILREVQQLRLEVRTSPEIIFALQVYSAVSNNNYVRFFRLVKQASFSSACIMHRYFTQVRNRALTSMMKTYGMGNKPAQIPISELVRLLGFENEHEASDFCEHYGFMTEDGDVILDRNDYLEPEAAWLPRRSVQLIESKRMVSVGEMINGENLPKFNIPTPVSSFDGQGRFKSAVELPGVEALSFEPAQQSSVAEVRGQEEVKQEPVAKVIKVEPTVPEPPPKPTNEMIKNMTKLLFWEVIADMVKEVSDEMIVEVKELLDFGDAIMENTVYSCVKDMLQTISHDVYEDAQAEHQRALKQEREERRERVAATLADEYLDDIVQQQVLSLATIEIREVKAQLKRECIERVTEELKDSMVQEVMSELVSEVAADVYETDVTQRLKQLQELEDIVKLSRAGKFLQKWKKEYHAVTKLKRAMLAFPSAPSMESSHDQLNHLLKNCRNDRVEGTRFYVNKQARLTVETPLEIEARWRRIDTQISVHALYQKLLLERAWAPLDLSKLLGQKLTEKLRGVSAGNIKRKRLHWKLVIFLPEVDPKDNPSSPKNVATHRLCDWLKAKMTKGKKPPAEKILKTEVLSLYKSIVSPPRSKVGHVSIGICVRAISGLPSEDELIMLEEERCMLGTDAVIFVLPAKPPMDDPYSDYWQSNVQRLQELLEVKPSNQAFPLVIIVAASANQNVSYNTLSECLNFDLFIDQGFICYVNIMVVDFDEKSSQGVNVVDPKVSEKLCESLQWLADLTNLCPDLSVSYLRDCVEGFLMEEYYTPVLQNLRKRKVLGHLHQNPDQLLELYNSVIQHLSDTLTSDSLLTVSWPVPEFTKNEELDTPPTYWNTEDQFEYLKQLIESLKLPQLVPFLYEPQSWEPVRDKIWNYVTSVADMEYGPARVTLSSRLKKLLHQVEIDFEETCYLTEGVNECQPTYSSIPWTDVITMCIDYKLSTLDIMDPNVTSQTESEVELKVAFYQSELRNFVPPQTWRHMESDKSILDTPSVQAVLHTVADKAREKLATTTIMPKRSSVVDQENQPPVAKEPKTTSELIKSLQVERRRSDHFQKYLENALKSDGEERTTISNAFEELSSETGFQDVNWKTASLKKFENTISSGSPFSVEENERCIAGGDQDVSMGTRLFGNQTIQFNEESCFGIPQSLQNVEKNVAIKRKSLGHLPQKSKRLSLDNSVRESVSETSQNDLTGTEAYRTSSESDFDFDIMTLPGRSRRQRLSEIYGDDKVMLSLYEPTVSEDIDLLKSEIKANRRESDLFEKKLRAALESDPFSNQSF